MTIEETAGPVLQVKDLTMHYQTRQGTVKAVDGISFELARGEVLGLVGESGCGKTSIAVTLMKLLPDNALILKGQVLLDGQDLMTMDDTTLRKYRWRRISMIFQAAMNSLNPVHRVGDQIVEAIEAHDMAATLKEAQETVDRLFRLVGLDPRLTDRYPHEFSGGMRQRAVIAMALACQPDVIVADEPTTALDVIVQDRILRQIKEIQTDLNMSMIYITHDIAVVAEVTDRIGVMYAGKLVELGSTADVFERPIHPYTKALLSVFPSIRGEKRPLTTLGGEPPNLVDPPTGCRFHPRCPYATAICQQEEPPIVVRDGHWAACWNPVG
ncbi:MAG: dipeptide/oligopeptide/nickel ABC transporter ATP-binding protein [SAR202 cluster bacterium MP-SInd-SRR3963457-G2]|jgi:peptide/nickel transport system ATP-binding protein|nr:MAG: dipeptide/oligopeptide/nickel ABC transporter ATP-binding protein [SAR202 cluster bacterium MP-SInd-SRR3963457-G2]HIM79911.1 ABC transporter ATP-binding protein [Dehalococcoidia bacterium]